MLEAESNGRAWTAIGGTSEVVTFDDPLFYITNTISNVSHQSLQVVVVLYDIESGVHLD